MSFGRLGLAVFVLLPACTTARAPVTTAQVLAVEPIAAPPTDAGEASSPGSVEAHAADDCARGFVEIVDGDETVRYSLGRELVPGVRGAKYAHVELVRHRDGSVVLSLEGIRRPDAQGGHLSLTVLGFREPDQLPAVFDEGYVEYMAEGLTAERDELRLDGPHVEITAWSPVGAWIEGTFGASAAAARSRPARSLRGRFRVCRTADWRPRI